MGSDDANLKVVTCCFSFKARVNKQMVKGAMDGNSKNVEVKNGTITSLPRRFIQDNKVIKENTQKKKVSTDQKAANFDKLKSGEVSNSPPPSTSSKSTKHFESPLDRSNFVLEHTRHLDKDYVISAQKLGSGTYGSVSRGIKKANGTVCAVKTITKKAVKNVDSFRQEIRIMKALDHPNIIKLFETYEDSRNIYLILELCSGGELLDRIFEVGHFSEKDAANLMLQIFSAISYLHSRNIMHRDIKPENFLFLRKSADSPLKIIDFGLSCRFSKGSFSTTKAGTPYYVAPQVLQGVYDEACDDWSAGVIMFILLSGKPPFYGSTDSEILCSVRDGSYDFEDEEWKTVSDDAKDLITKLLQYNPRERLTSKEAIEHPWIKKMTQTETVTFLPETLLKNLKNFYVQSHFKKVALTIIARNLSERDIKSLRNLFVQLDIKHTGTLDLLSISEALKSLGHGQLIEEIKNNIMELDSDKSGLVDYTEFVAATIDAKLYIQENVCWEAFRIFDMDGNGKITCDELHTLLGSEGVKSVFTKNIAENMIDQCDLDQDGSIDFNEFMHMMREKSA